VHPPGTLIARWRCPIARRTLSELPDWLGAWRAGTLVELEALVIGVEQAGSLANATKTLRTDIDLPGALRQLGGLTRAVHAGLRAVRGLEPERFGLCAPTLAGFAAVLGLDPNAGDSVLATLRLLVAVHLPQLAAPLGFDPRRIRAGRQRTAFQHDPGADLPGTLAEPCDPSATPVAERPP